MALGLARRRLPTFWMLKSKVQTSHVGKGSGLLVGVCLLLSTVLLVPGNAWAQSEPNTNSPAWLASFPAPNKVRADVVASAGDAEPEVIEGRVAGRLETLANALYNSWASGYSNPETGLPVPGIEWAPTAAKKLHEAYSNEMLAITRHANKTYPKCGFFRRLLQLTGIANACKRLAYKLAREESDGTFTNNEQAAAQIAMQYFPPEMQELFIEASGGSGRYMSRHQVIVARANRDAERVGERSTARWASARNGMEGRWVPGGALVLIGIGWLLIFLDARPRKAPDPQKVNEISDIADLAIFDKRGHVVGTHERTSLHTTTTVTTSGGGGYVHPTYGGHVSAPSTTTTTSTTSKHHQTLFIRQEDGVELEVAFIDLHFSVRDGTHVAIVYAGDRWSNRGHPIAAVNLDTGRWEMAGSRVDWIVTNKPTAQLWVWIMLVPLAPVVMAFVAGTSFMVGIVLGVAIAIFLAWRWWRRSALAALKTAVVSRIRAYAQSIVDQR